jgi:hypothetical protein
MSYAPLMTEMKDIQTKHSNGICIFTERHKRVFYKLAREHNWTRNNIRMLKHYIIANRMSLVNAFKKVYNSQYI